MPEMGESVTEGTVLEWHVEEGQQVSEGDTVVEVSTDKVDAEVPAPASGTITKLLVAPDDTVQVGQALAEMSAGDAPAAKPARPPTAERAPAEAPPAAAGDGDGRASPVARRVAAAKGVDIATVKGSGPGGKVTKEDVLAAADGNGARPDRRRAAEAEAKPLRGPAAMLAKAMNESRSMPTATSFRTLPVDTLDAKRKAINASAQGARDEGLLHPPDRLGDRQGDARLAGDGAHLRGARRQADVIEPGARQPRDRGRRRAQGRLAQPDGALRQGRRDGSTSPPSTPPTRS